MRSDDEIKALVEDELARDLWIDVEDVIAVAVKDGVVTLTGFARSYDAKVEAEQRAKRIDGVVGVVNDIEVRLPGADERPDPDIARDIALMFKLRLPDVSDRIRVTVERGLVSLEGEVDDDRRRAQAEEIVRHLKGVRDIENAITVHPR